jgi:virulence factor Mce-like protein
VNKKPPTAAGLTAIVVFALSCFGLLLYLWLSFGGPAPLKPKGYQVKVPFREAAQLGQQADVRVAGVTVGHVVAKTIPPERSDVVMATLEIEREYAPIRSDARATLRAKTVLGETYVELRLGSRDAPAVPEGGTLDDGRVQAQITLDELLGTFDPYTRQAFRTWQHSLGGALEGRGRDLNDALGNLPGFVDSAGDLVTVLDANREALQGVVRDTGEVFEALTADEAQLARLITTSDQTFEAIARRKEAFAETWQIFPTFLRESRRTSRALEGFSDRAAPVLRDLAPATDDLAVSLQALGRAAPDLRRFLVGLDPLREAAREGLPASTELLRGLRPLVRALEPYLGEVNPLLDWVGHHSYTLTDMLSNLGVATSARTASRNPQATGHYLRQFGPTGVESFGAHRTRLDTNRGNTYLNPLTLAQRIQGQSGITAAWDCANAEEGSGPKCRVDAPYTFQGVTARFPHVRPETYRSGRARPVGR